MQILFNFFCYLKSLTVWDVLLFQEMDLTQPRKCLFSPKMWGFLYKISMEITLYDTLYNSMLNLEHPHETKKKKLNDPTIMYNIISITNSEMIVFKQNLQYSTELLTKFLKTYFIQIYFLLRSRTSLILVLRQF